MPFAKPQSKVDVDPNFDERLHQLATRAKEDAEQLRRGGQVMWNRPDEWAGDPFDYEAMTKPFNRDKANEGYVDAVKDPASPGVTGDLVNATMMIDYLATMERAFRNRHTMTRPRRVCHTAGRKVGQGSNKGVFIQGVLEFLRRCVQRAKGPK